MGINNHWWNFHAKIDRRWIMFVKIMLRLCYIHEKGSHIWTPYYFFNDQLIV